MTDGRKNPFDEKVSKEFRDRVFASVASELEKNRERAKDTMGRRWFLWSSALGSVTAAAAVVIVYMRGGKMPKDSGLAAREGIETALMDPELLEVDTEMLADLEILEELEQIEGLEEEIDV